MAPMAPRTSFHSSRLIRFLAELKTAEVKGSNQSLAERLGLWLGWAHAISLSAALNEDSARPPAALPGMPFPGNAAVREFARVRAALAHSITTDDVFTAGKASVKSTPALDASIDNEADFAPYRRCYVAHQRAMDASIRPLRASVREALASVSPKLSRLAALDAVMDDVLSARERSLLSTVPSLLEKRFDALCKVHQETLANPGPTGADPPLQPAGGWLDVYSKDMQGVLLAELDIRMQPVEGLIEALASNTALGSVTI